MCSRCSGYPSVAPAARWASRVRRSASFGWCGLIDEAALTDAVVSLAAEYGRYGYRRIMALLRADGWRVNAKRVERIWRREGLKVPRRQPKRGRLWLNDGSCIRLRPCWPGHVWAYDFVQDRTHDGRRFRMLTVIDDTRGSAWRSWWRDG